MALHYGPRIPGIALNRQYYLDPVLGKSYTGGTSTINLVENSTYNSANATGNLTNGTAFSSLGNGSFLFDGGNDQIRFDLGSNTSNPLFLPEVCTVYVWVYPLSSTGAIFSHWSGGPVNLGYYIENGKISVAQYWSDWRYYSSAGTSVPTNTWSQIAWVRSSSTSMSLYLNDSLNGTLTPDTGAGQFFGGGNQGVLGSLWGWKFFNGYMGVFMIYHEAHTLAQVQQTFNMYRSRYGV
jgi:hypothetical protein